VGHKIDDSSRLHRLTVVYGIEEGTFRMGSLALPFGDARRVIAYPSIVGVSVERVAIDSRYTLKVAMDTRHDVTSSLLNYTLVPFRLYPEGGRAQDDDTIPDVSHGLRALWLSYIRKVALYVIKRNLPPLNA
jgi:hypothetical protein